MPNYPDKVHNIIIPDGNYTKESFKIMMNNYFSKVNGGLEILYVDIDPVTISTVFRVNTLFYDTTYVTYDPTTFYFVLDFTITSDTNRPLYKNLGWMLGFRKKYYTVNYNKTYLSYTVSNISTIFYRGYCQGESYYGCSIDNYFFVEIDDFHNNFPTDTIMSVNDTNSNYLGKNIIARITITSGINTIVTDNASDKIFKKREYFGPVNIDKFKIRLLNRFGDVINLNNNDYSFTLELKQIYS